MPKGVDINGTFYFFKFKNVGVSQLQLISRKIERVTRDQDLKLRFIEGLTKKLDGILEKDFDTIEEMEESYNTVVNKINSYHEQQIELDGKMNQIIDASIYDICSEIENGSGPIPQDTWHDLPLPVKLSAFQEAVSRQSLPASEELENFTNT